MTTIIREVPSTPKPLPTPKKPSTKSSPNVVDNNDNGIDSGSIRILPTPTVAVTKKIKEVKTKIQVQVQKYQDLMAQDL